MMHAAEIAPTPAPPYFAVIFTSRQRATDGYIAAADAMLALASIQPGFLGFESARGEDGLGVTVSYWASLEAIAAWKSQSDHRAVQEAGRADWYQQYTVRICSVERSYSFDAAVTAIV